MYFSVTDEDHQPHPAQVSHTGDTGFEAMQYLVSSVPLPLPPLSLSLSLSLSTHTRIWECDTWQHFLKLHWERKAWKEKESRSQNSFRLRRICFFQDYTASHSTKLLLELS